MTNRERFIKAHALTRETTARFGGDYRATFAACLSYVYNKNEDQIVSKYTELLTQYVADTQEDLERARNSSSPRAAKWIQTYQDRLSAAERFEAVIAALPEDIQRDRRLTQPAIDDIASVVVMIAQPREFNPTADRLESAIYNAVRAAA